MLLSQHYPLLTRYRTQLKELRKNWRNVRELPEVPFFLFGMGARQKFIYRDGKLMDGQTGAVIRQWEAAEETIAPPAYRVVLETRQGDLVEINEDERGIWLVENGQPSLLSESPVKLPAFGGHPFNLVLRVLHQEILVNILDGKPLPNALVYPRPWVRDSAMMAMVLKQTGNLDLIENWILGLDDPYDRNNAGEGEPDNLGQALYLISLVAGRSHPLVAKILQLLPGLTVDRRLTGHTDFGDHPVYQTKWLKFGLAALGLEDTYAIPAVSDPYAPLFWWDYRQPFAGGENGLNNGFSQGVSADSSPGLSPGLSLNYPYLTWAEDHFFSRQLGPVGSRDYPLSWEAEASQANYAQMALISPEFARQRLAAPHTWHAAEMFLALSDFYNKKP